MRKTYEAPRLILDQYVQDTMIASASPASSGGGSRPSNNSFNWWNIFWPWGGNPGASRQPWQKGPGRH